MQEWAITLGLERIQAFETGRQPPWSNFHTAPTPRGLKGRHRELEKALVDPAHTEARRPLQTPTRVTGWTDACDEHLWEVEVEED